MNRVDNFRILLIDDDEDDFFNIRDLFEDVTRSRYEVVWKSNYEEGLQSLQSEKFDACLLDYRLGAQTGLDLLKEAQAVTELNCPVIFLTGHSDFDLDLQAMLTGASDYLVKGQLTGPLLEKTIRYTMKHRLDMEELKESKAQILQQDRLASLGLLASSLAHEIGTPMGIIRSRAEICARRAGDNSVLKDDMHTIVTQIDRIAKLVNSLLHIAREKQSSHAVAVNFNTVVHDVLNLVRPELDRKDITLQLHLFDDPFVKAEAGPLGQVLINLLINSIHAIDEARRQGMASAHQISLSTAVSNGFVEVILQDSGCGIPEKNLQHLFKPFFTTKAIGLGTGLGLATSFKIVQSWGGSITVQSLEGQGATFKILLHRN